MAHSYNHLLYAYYWAIFTASPDAFERIRRRDDIDPGEQYFRTPPAFEAGAETYAWLNKIIAVGRLTLPTGIAFFQDDERIVVIEKGSALKLSAPYPAPPGQVTALTT